MLVVALLGGAAWGEAGCTPKAHPEAAPSPQPAGSGATSETPSPSSSSGTPADRPDPLVASMLRQVERARHLPAKRPVASKTLDRTALLGQVRSHLDHDVPREAIRGQGEMMVAFELIPPTYDYEKGVFELLEAQLAGYYEPADKTMYLARDLGEDDAEATLAHELVHALQDQHYDLGPKLEYKPEGGDVSGAIHALAEGDAMSAMLDISMSPQGQSVLDLPDALLARKMRQGILDAPSTASVPPVLKSSLVSPYTDGMLFVHALRRRGGWAEVDRVWKSPPTTTEQLIHLDKYDAHEPPLAVPAPRLDALGGGFQVIFSDVFGEQSLRIALEAWGDEKASAAAAAGWGGDRVAVLRRVKGGVEEFLVTWYLRFDGSPTRCRDAQEAWALVAPGVSPGSRHDRNATVCRDRSELGPIAASTAGCDIVISAGPYSKTGEKRESQGSCKQIEGWLKKGLEAH
jgi:hypothetical protein